MNTVNSFLNKVFFKSSQEMTEVPNQSVDLVLTSPPYFNIKDYAKNGYQSENHSVSSISDLGSIDNYETFIGELLKVWKECERVLKPNGKLIINTPLVPMKKASLDTHYNRHIFDLNADIQNSILKSLKNIFLLDIYIWNRTNATKNLMFGSYPYPGNFYAQNTSEFISVYVKDGTPVRKPTQAIKESSKLTEKEWVEYTKQIWDIPIPNKGDLAFGKHSAIMPEEIVRRCVRLFTFENEVVLDPFTGSGTTLKVTKELNRAYIGYEVYEQYKNIIHAKVNSGNDLFAPQHLNHQAPPQIVSEIKDKITFSLDEETYGVLEYVIKEKTLTISDLQVSIKRKGIGTRLIEDLDDLISYYFVEVIKAKIKPNKENVLFFLKHGFEVSSQLDFKKILEITKSGDDEKLLLSVPDNIIMERQVTVRKAN